MDDGLHVTRLKTAILLNEILIARIIITMVIIINNNNNKNNDNDRHNRLSDSLSKDSWNCQASKA